jgi:phosphate uptake regulator
LFTLCDTIDEAYDAIIRHLKKYYSKEKEPKVIEPVLHLQ